MIWLEHLKLSRQDRTIRDLSNQEREYVIKEFVERIGASELLDSKAWKVIPYERLVKILKTDDWPGPITTHTELTWLSHPLDNANFKDLKGYSIFWQKTDNALEMWIGRYSERPQDTNSILTDSQLLAQILSVCRLYLSEEMRVEHSNSVVKRWLRQMTFALVPQVLGLAFISTLVFQAFGISYRSAYLLLGYLIGVTLTHYATKLFGQRSILVIVVAMLLLLIVYLQVLIEDANSLLQLDIYVFCACWILGIFAADQRGPSMTIREVWDLPGWNRVRGVYEGSIRTTSIVTVFTYGAFRLAEYSIANIDWGSSLVLLPLLPMAVVAVAEFVKREIERE